MAGLGCRGVNGIASLRVLVWGCPAPDCPSPTSCWLEAMACGCQALLGAGRRDLSGILGDSDGWEELPLPGLAVPMRTAHWATGT